MDPEQDEFRKDSLLLFTRFGFVPTAVEIQGDDFLFLVHGLTYLLSCVGHSVAILPLSPTLTLGEKVRVGELLLAALELKMPTGLSPHQLVLGDWKCLQPMIHSLGRLAQEARLQHEILSSSRIVSSPVKPLTSSLLMDSKFPLTPNSRHELEALIAAQNAERKSKALRLNALSEELESLSVQLREEKARSSLKHLDQATLLLEELDQLRQMEKEFRATCREELERLRARETQSAQFPSHELLELEEKKASLEAVRKSTMARLVPRIKARDAIIRGCNDSVPEMEYAQYRARIQELAAESVFQSETHRKELAVYNSYVTKLRHTKDQIALLTSLRDGLIRGDRQALVSQFPKVLQDFDFSLARSREWLAQLQCTEAELDVQLEELYEKRKTLYYSQDM